MEKFSEYHLDIMRKCCDTYDTLLDGVDSLPKLEVRESPKGGLGVFAVNDIKVGSIVTYYPCHYFQADLFDGIAIGCGMRGDDKTDDQYRVMMADYSMLFGPDHVGMNLFLVGDPEVHDFVGHMLNDSVDIEELKKSARKVMLGKFDAGRIRGFERDYDRLVKPNVRGTFKPGAYCAPISTSCDIHAGEELLMNYGHIYWLTKLTGRKCEVKTGKWVKV